MEGLAEIHLPSNFIRHANQKAMSLKEWLPIRKRNRVALFLAGLSLVMFVVWNFLPVYDFDGRYMGTGASETWPNYLSSHIYMYQRNDVDFEWLAARCICISLPLSGLVSILMIPFWQMLHASRMIRIPLAHLCLAGGVASISYYLSNIRSNIPDGGWYWILIYMASSMLLNAAALLTFRNELALRDERSRL